MQAGLRFQSSIVSVASGQAVNDKGIAYTILLLITALMLGVFCWIVTFRTLASLVYGWK